MQIIFFLLSIVSTKEISTTSLPLKIEVLYFSPVDKNLKTELLQNITATYNCTVTEKPGSI